MAHEELVARVLQALTRRPEGELEVVRLGRTGYEEAHALQEALVARRIDGELGDLLLLTEHEPVLTVGRGNDPAELAGASVPVVAVERGGDATYHGPGQLVAYPILLLPEERRDLHAYLRDLEEVVIGVLSELDVVGTRRPGLTGVWVDQRKIASIGVSVRRWVTWHGFALNVHTDLGAFAGFRPCGLDPDVMTRLADVAEVPPGLVLVEVLAVKHICRVFGVDLPSPPQGPAPPSTIGGPDGAFPALPILPS